MVGVRLLVWQPPVDHHPPRDGTGVGRGNRRETSLAAHHLPDLAWVCLQVERQVEPHTVELPAAELAPEQPGQEDHEPLLGQRCLPRHQLVEQS